MFSPWNMFLIESFQWKDFDGEPKRYLGYSPWKVWSDIPRVQRILITASNPICEDVIIFKFSGMFVMASLTFLVRYLLSARSNLSAWGGLWWLWYPGKVCTWVKILWNSLKSGCIIRWMVQLTCPPENFEMPERVARSQCWLKSKFSLLNWNFPKIIGHFCQIFLAVASECLLTHLAMTKRSTAICWPLHSRASLL